jgi:hypothetical protein
MRFWRRTGMSRENSSHNPAVRSFSLTGEPRDIDGLCPLVSLVVVRKHLSDAARESLPRRDVQELVGAVGVGIRP